MTDRRRFPEVFPAISALLMSLAAVTAGAAPSAAVAQFQPFKIGSYSAVALKDGGIEEPVDGSCLIPVPVGSSATLPASCQNP